jgi:hypothetical protein
MYFLPPYTVSVRIQGPSSHAWVPPPPPGAPLYLYAEAPHTLGWVHPGKFTNASIRFDGHKVARDGHDTGPGIVHVTAPLNPGMGLATLLSKYKINFGAAKVKVQGDAVAIFLWVIAPPAFCGVPMTLPAMGVLNSLATWSTVKVGASAMDLVAGWASTAIDAAADLLTWCLTGGVKPPGAFDVKDVVKGLAIDIVKGLAVDVIKAGARYATTGSWGSIRADIIANHGLQINENPDTGLPANIQFGTPGDPGWLTLGSEVPSAPTPKASPPAAPNLVGPGVVHVQ